MDVKKIREKMGVTQLQLAGMCGVTLRTVQNWETGKSLPERAQKLLEAIASSSETISSCNAAQNGVSVAAGTGSQVTLNPDTQQFFSTLERQQDIMSRQLEELAEMRRLTQKKDEQIDMLLKLIQARQ